MLTFNCFRDFEDGTTISALGYDIVLRRRSAGSLHLTSGHLIACDPLTALETEPFAQVLPRGVHPVSLFVAELRDELRIAYAMVRVGEGEPVRWEVAEVPAEQNVHPLIARLEQEDGGFAVDSTVACFMDIDAATSLIDYNQIVLPEENEFEKVLVAGLRKRRKRGYGWTAVDLKADLKIPCEDGRNLVAFDAGYGRGVYTTYFGRDTDDEIVAAVIDFQVLDFRFPSFAFRR